MTDYAQFLPLAQEAVDLAHDLMRTLQPGALTYKGDRDMASEVDYAIERAVREHLAAKAPDIGFLGEEYGSSGDTSTLTWALDPVDGTVNFVHGSPLCAISLGLIHGTDAVLGVIDLPFLETRYHAAKGNGATPTINAFTPAGSPTSRKPSSPSATTRSATRPAGRTPNDLLSPSSSPGTSNGYACTVPPQSTWRGWPTAGSTRSSCSTTSPGTRSRAS